MNPDPYEVDIASQKRRIALEKEYARLEELHRKAVARRKKAKLGGKRGTRRLSSESIASVTNIIFPRSWQKA